MARPKKRAEKEMEATAIQTKPVRLDLSVETHRKLRVVAAEKGLPMAVYARDLVEQSVEREYAELRGNR
jgi:hypothetical protein